MAELPPRAEVVDALLYLAAPAAGAAAVVFGGVALLGGLAGRAAPRFGWRSLAPSAAALAAAAALFAGNHFRGGFPDDPAKWEKWWHWAWPAALLMTAAEVTARLPGVAVEVGHLLRGVAAGVAAGAVVPPAWQEADRWLVPAVALAVAAEWALVDAVGRRAPGGWVAAAVAVPCWGAAAVLLHAEQALFMKTAAGLCVGLAVVAVLAWATRSDGGAAGAAATGPLAMLLLLGRYLRDSPVPPGSFLLVGLSPALLGLFLLPGVRRLNDRRLGGVLKVLLVLVPVAVAVYRAMEAAPYSFGPKEEEW